MRDWNPRDMWVPYNPKTYRFLSYASPHNKDIEWINVWPFQMHFKIESYERGRSSVLFWLKDRDSDKRYPISFADLMDMLSESTVVNDEFTEPWKFTFKKKGVNYFIVPQQKVALDTDV